MATLIGLAGCSQSGTRALLQADALLSKGQPLEALKKLERAKNSMPDEPRMWNLLGLAYHRSGQPQLAAQAYQQALAKDKSNLVAIAHYNFGCLLLEENNPAAAADHFRSYTLTTNNVAGLVKLAAAQLRLRRLDSAEANFGGALRLEPKNAEALNGVGVVHALRNQRDAMQYFNAALQSNPKYAPAMLNAAVLAQQSPASRPAALQRFKDYLATAPRSPQAGSVRRLVEQLEAEFAQQTAVSNALVLASLKSNALLAAARATNTPATNLPPRLPTVITNAKPPVVAVKTNPPPPITNQVVQTTNKPVPIVPTNPPLVLVSLTNVPPPKIAVATPETVPAVTIAPSPVTTATTSTTVTVPEPAPPTMTSREDEPKKPGFFTRLNPFRSKREPEPDPVEVPRNVVLTPRTNNTVALPKPAYPRYTYLSPAIPHSGNRADAERAASQAIKAERAGNTNEAWLNYHLAITADPGYFEAQYNAALLAYRLGDLKRALAGCETALAIKPESIDARYNFALALKQANYAHDAVNELQRILEAKPKEVRAHLILGNLYAQQLDDPQKARAHYARVLELEPRNTQAAAIRFWLAANP